MLSKFMPFALLLAACHQPEPVLPVNTNQFHAPPGRPATVGDIPLPPGFERINAGDAFAAWLRKIQLKKDRMVYLFNGRPKTNQQAQYAVLDIPVGTRDLQQCADAVMRLRAEFLYSSGKFDQLLFLDNDATRYAFNAPYSRTHFENFMQGVFGMCGSASLSRQMAKSVEVQFVNPGDVLIRGGFPGHAMMVMDVAENKKGERIYLLAQSYMPAQDIHIVVNPEGDISPWYRAANQPLIRTPEYTFTGNELKRW